MRVLGGRPWAKGDEMAERVRRGGVPRVLKQRKVVSLMRVRPWAKEAP